MRQEKLHGDQSPVVEFAALKKHAASEVTLKVSSLHDRGPELEMIRHTPLAATVFQVPALEPGTSVQLWQAFHLLVAVDRRDQ